MCHERLIKISRLLSDVFLQGRDFSNLMCKYTVKSLQITIRINGDDEKFLCEFFVEAVEFDNKVIAFFLFVYIITKVLNQMNSS